MDKLLVMIRRSDFLVRTPAVGSVGCLKHFHIDISLSLSGAEPDQQNTEKNEEGPTADCPAEEESHTRTHTPPERQDTPENADECENSKEQEQDGNEDVREEEEEEEEDKTVEEETEATLSQSTERETHECPNEEEPDQVTIERQEDEEEEEEDDDEEEENESQEPSSKDHNDTCRTNGHVIICAQEHLSSPLLCPLVESEISTTDREASDTSYELFNGETVLTNGARHRGTTPRFPELPLDPEPDDSERDEAQALNSDRSRTVSSSSTGDTPKGQTHVIHACIHACCFLEWVNKLCVHLQ